MKEQLEQARKQDNYLQESDTALTLHEQKRITNLGNVIFELDYRENINPEAVQEVEEEVKQEVSQSQLSNTQTPLVKRFGISPEAVPNAAGYNIICNRLHYVEQEVFNLAIQELSSKLSAQDLQSQQVQEYLCNVVVVDIFAREQGKIKTTQVGLPETHTVVLWKKEPSTIVLIDPSHTKFSQHIDSLIIGNYSIMQSISGGDIVYSTQRKETGYSPYEEQNPKPRDCIDIAVKIAFEINEQQKESTNIEQITQNVFSQISNKKRLSRHLDKIDGTFIRELQSSSKNIRREAKRFLEDEAVQLIVPKVIGENLDIIKETHNAHIWLEQQSLYVFFKEHTKGIIQSISQKK